MGALVKKLFSVMFLGLLLTLFFIPGNVLAYSFNFSGTVLHDSNASSYCLPGFGHNFKRSLVLGDDASSQMGMIWWSDPRNFTIGQHSLTGGGSNLRYRGCRVVHGGSNLRYRGCRVADGTSFVVEQSSSSAVPLPASVWFLGSGLLFLIRRRKR